MRRVCWLGVCVAASMWAQAPPRAAAPKPVVNPASLSGTVIDGATGRPVAGVEIRVNSPTPAHTDESGRFTVRNIPAGRYEVRAGMPVGQRPVYSTRTVTLSAGQDLMGFDFRVELNGTITGRVVDHNEEPVPGAQVYGLVREYRAGGVYYFRRSYASADDQGVYRIEGVTPGRGFVLMASRRTTMPTISDSPIDPKLRKPAVRPTYYPNSPTPEGATPVMVRPGEERNGVDFVLMRSPAHCISGTLTDNGWPGAVGFLLADRRVSYGMSSGGGLAGLPPSGKTGEDGRIRLCDLPSGEYMLSVYTGDINRPDSFGSSVIAIGDRDVSGVVVPSVAHVPVEVRLAWAGEPPPEAPAAEVPVMLMPLDRAISGTPSGRFKIPSAAPLQAPAGLNTGITDPLIGVYEFSVRRLPRGYYVKDVRYGTESVVGAPVLVGSAPAGSALEASIGHDGGFVEATVADRNGNPVPDATVIVMPRRVRSEAELAERRVAGRTDQNGFFATEALEPGTYLALAMAVENDGVTVDEIARVWGARSKAQEIDVASKASVRVSLQPVALQ